MGGSLPVGGGRVRASRSADDRGPVRRCRFGVAEVIPPRMGRLRRTQIHQQGADAQSTNAAGQEISSTSQRRDSFVPEAPASTNSPTTSMPPEEAAPRHADSWESSDVFSTCWDVDTRAWIAARVTSGSARTGPFRTTDSPLSAGGGVTTGPSDRSHSRWAGLPGQRLDQHGQPGTVRAWHNGEPDFPYPGRLVFRMCSTSAASARVPPISASSQVTTLTYQRRSITTIPGRAGTGSC